MPARKRYDLELEDIPDQYKRVLSTDVSSLRNALMGLAEGPTVFIGTGGTFAIAKFAAQLHEAVSGQAAQVVTPLGLTAIPERARRGAVLFSSGLKHPDALSALRRIGGSTFRPALVVTLREKSSAVDLAPPDVHVETLQGPGFREGFLATTSVLIMMTSLLKAYLGGESMPPALPELEFEMPHAVDRLLVLSGPNLDVVSTDIETRCHELGLAAVQVSDFRNFAHGRHVGLERQRDRTAVLALVSPPFDKVADSTLQVLALAGFNPTVWRSHLEGPAAVIELSVASMHLAASLAESQHVAVARPGASAFGRRLYHLNLRRSLPETTCHPVDRKLFELSVGPTSRKTRQSYRRAFRRWLTEINKVRFAGLVLDYDGTVCATEHRTELPNAQVQRGLVDLLEAGVSLGFASGRGQSLHRDLRNWLPERHWKEVVVGLYNGGVVLGLDSDLPDLSTPQPVIEKVLQRLEQMPMSGSLDIEPRCVQVTVSPHPGMFADRQRLAAMITAAMHEEPALPVKVFLSGHSIDVLSASSTKRSVTTYLETATEGRILAIGDQGSVGGNDFELLSGAPWTLSVDGCSADPTRCWNLDTEGRSGPEVLRSYLSAISAEDGLFQFAWSEP